MFDTAKKHCADCWQTSLTHLRPLPDRPTAHHVRRADSTQRHEWKKQQQTRTNTVSLSLYVRLAEALFEEEERNNLALRVCRE